MTDRIFRFLVDFLAILAMCAILGLGVYQCAMRPEFEPKPSTQKP
jgi:hypothetical protein